MSKRTISVMVVICLLLALPAMATGKKPQDNFVTILYVDQDNGNDVVGTWEFIPEGPGSYTLDNDSAVILQGLPQGYGLLDGNRYTITVHRDGRISPSTVKFKVKHVAVSPTPTVEPTATPVPTVKPTATPDSGNADYEPPKSGDASVLFSALSAIAAAAVFLRRR